LVPRDRFGAAFRPVVRLRAPARLPAAERRVVALRFLADPRFVARPRERPPFFFPADEREDFREPPRPPFFAFFATFTSLFRPAFPGLGSYNSEFVEASRVGRETARASAISPGFPAMKTEIGPRVLIVPHPGGLTVEIRPLVRSRVWRRRLAAGAAIVVVASLFGVARLVPLWEASLRRGSFSELPLPVLVFLSLAVGITTPLTLIGLAALAFAEERVEVGPSEVVISTTAFERTRVRRLSIAELDCWRETYVPLSPWWSWSVKRLAARSQGQLFPIAGGAGPKEKRAIGLALSRATGRPLVADFGRVIEAGSGLHLPH
jgi:hypothetical protein